LVPGTSGTFADQLVVPVAVPVDAVELLQVTEVTSPEAVPMIAIVAAEVETIVNPGEVIFRPGGAPDGGAGLDGVGEDGEEGAGFPGFAGVPDAVWRATVITREATQPVPSVAVTVIIFIPRFRGTTGILQSGAPAALPEGPSLLVQATCGLPVPPVTMPDMAIEEVVGIPRRRACAIVASVPTKRLSHRSEIFVPLDVTC